MGKPQVYISDADGSNAVLLDNGTWRRITGVISDAPRDQGLRVMSVPFVIEADTPEVLHQRWKSTRDDFISRNRRVRASLDDSLDPDADDMFVDMFPGDGEHFAVDTNIGEDLGRPTKYSLPLVFTAAGVTRRAYGASGTAADPVSEPVPTGLVELVIEETFDVGGVRSRTATGKYLGDGTNDPVTLYDSGRSDLLETYLLTATTGDRDPDSGMAVIYEATKDSDGGGIGEDGLEFQIVSREIPFNGIAELSIRSTKTPSGIETLTASVMAFATADGNSAVDNYEAIRGTILTDYLLTEADGSVSANGFALVGEELSHPEPALLDRLLSVELQANEITTPLPSLPAVRTFNMEIGVTTVDEWDVEAGSPPALISAEGSAHIVGGASIATWDTVKGEVLAAIRAKSNEPSAKIVKSGIQADIEQGVLKFAVTLQARNSDLLQYTRTDTVMIHDMLSFADLEDGTTHANRSPASPRIVREVKVSRKGRNEATPAEALGQTPSPVIPGRTLVITDLREDHNGVLATEWDPLTIAQQFSFQFLELALSDGVSDLESAIPLSYDTLR